LPADRPAVLNPDLASSLHNLSIYLTGLGCREDVLNAIQQAIELQQLAADRPAVFNLYIANSSNTLSHCLAELDYREDALKAIQHAGKLYQQLATTRTTVFNPGLAESLNLSC
jgi:tetratricopeptide (TPR) repeat protein